MEANSIIQRWDDLVFENRNKRYGAYLLRRAYPDRVFAGAMAAVFFVLMILTLHSSTKTSKNGVPKPRVWDEGVLVFSQPPPLEPRSRPKSDAHKPPKSTARSQVILVSRTEVDDDQVADTVEDYVETDEEGEGVFDIADVIGEIYLPPPLPVVDEPIDIAEVMPEYEGGMEAMMKFIQKRIRYPRVPREMGIDGTVYVRFIVNGNGSVSDVMVIRGIHRDCDEEAVRVVSMLPAWKGGRHNGRPAAVRMVLPIKFKLD